MQQRQEKKRKKSQAKQIQTHRSTEKRRRNLFKPFVKSKETQHIRTMNTKTRVWLIQIDSDERPKLCNYWAIHDQRTHSRPPTIQKDEKTIIFRWSTEHNSTECLKIVFSIVLFFKWITYEKRKSRDESSLESQRKKKNKLNYYYQIICQWTVDMASASSAENKKIRVVLFQLFCLFTFFD